MIRSAIWLRPIQTPTTTPNTMVRTVAIRVAARVSMASCHNPIAMIRPRQIAVHAVARLPPMTYAMAARAAKVSQNGELSSKDCNGLSPWLVTVSLIQPVTPDRCADAHLVTELPASLMALPTGWVCVGRAGELGGEQVGVGDVDQHRGDDRAPMLTAGRRYFRSFDVAAARRWTSARTDAAVVTRSRMIAMITIARPAFAAVPTSRLISACSTD